MRRVVMAFVVAALLAAVGAAGNAGDKAGKKDEDRIRGTWLPVSAEEGGRKEPDEKLKDSKIVFGEGGKLSVTIQGKEMEGTYKLDATKKPKAIDVTINEGGKDETHKGIYHLEKDSLKLCFADPDRPTEFATQAGTKSLLLVLKRAKK
jgi:uncharacterized protein (TIGR03067 family)